MLVFCVCRVVPNMKVSGLGWKLQEQNKKLVFVQICANTCRVLASARYGWISHVQRLTDKQCAVCSNKRWAKFQQTIYKTALFTR